MAKRLLLFVVFCFVFVSYVSGQCNKQYRLLINDGFDYFSSTSLPTAHYPSYVCKGTVMEFKITTAISDKVLLNWYRNDTLITKSNNPIFETSGNGAFKVTIEDGNCKYNIGYFVFEEIETIPISLSTNELAICENIKSPTPIFAFSEPKFTSKDDIKFQWQKDGKDIVNATDNRFSPSASGTYTVRATSANCSATSTSVSVKASTDNRIYESLHLYRDINVDTLFLCESTSYSLTGNSLTNWYRDNQFVKNSFEFTPTKSGTYYTKREVGTNCFVESKPFYISIGKRIPSLSLSVFGELGKCDGEWVAVDDKNISGNVPNFLTIAPISGNGLTKTYSDIVWNTNFKLNFGKYKVNFKEGSCISDPYILDISPRKPFLKNYINGEKIGGKKINLCHNSSIIIEADNFEVNETKLYKDGKLLYTKRNSPYSFTTSFNISDEGKYFIQVTNFLCNLTLNSDTVEIVGAELISTNLDVKVENCSIGAMQLKVNQYKDFTYTWYKDEQIITGANSSILDVKQSQAANYYAVLRKGLCSVATQSYSFATKEKIIGLKKFCEGEKIELKSSITEAIYLWKGPDNSISNSSTININSSRSQNTGWYTLQTTKNGCTFIDSLEIAVVSKGDMSINFANPVCKDRPLLLEVSGKSGDYYINYNLSEGSRNYKYFYLYENNEKAYINLGNINNTSPDIYMKDMVLTYSNCSFPLNPPALATPEICADIIEFKNIQQKYCIKERFTLKINLPKNIGADKKFKLHLQNYTRKYDFGMFSGDSIQLQIPSSFGGHAHFVLENEDGSFITISKEFVINGTDHYVYAAIGNRFYSDEVTQCEGYQTNLLSYTYENVSIQWKKNGVNLVGATESEYQVKEHGIYSFVVNDNGCVIESDSINIKVVDTIPKPLIKSETGITIACEDFSVPLREETGFPYTSYEWMLKGKLLGEKTENNFFRARVSGYYKLSAYQGACEASSDSVWVEIGQKLSNTISVSRDIRLETNKAFICGNSIATFTLSDYSIDSLKNYGFSFKWRRDNKDITGANSAFYSTSEPGTYYLQLTQGDCIANSNKIEVIRKDTLNVNVYHKFPFSDANKTVSLCKDVRQSYLFYISQPFDEMKSWNIDLYKDGKLIETRTADKNNYTSSAVFVKESGKYSAKLYASNENTCIALSDTANFKFIDQIIRFPTDTVYSCYDSVYLNAPYFGNSYEWKYDNKLISTSEDIKVSEVGLYSVNIKQTNTCGYSQLLLFERKLKPTLAYSYNDPDATSITICDKANTELYVRDINWGPGMPLFYTFEWYRNQEKLPSKDYFIKIGQEGNYQAKVKYKTCEALTNTFKVDRVQIKNQISPLVDSLGICINGGFQTLETSKENGYTYEWFKDNVGIEESSSTLKANQPGTYKALIQSRDCYALTPKVKVYASTQPPTATISGDTTLNIGDTANLKLSFTSSPPFTYKLNNNQEGTSDNNNIVHPVKIEEATIFKLASIKNACGEGTVSGEAKIQVIILANEPLIGHKITIAPVPAESYCEIVFDLPTSQEVSYQLLDMKGQQLSEKNLGKITYKKQYLNLNQLATGEYLIRIQVGKEFVTRKLIKF